MAQVFAIVTIVTIVCLPAAIRPSIVAFLAMGDISDEHRRVAMAAGRDACANIEAACQTKCEATIRVAMKDWCSGSRQCHATCMLRQFYTQTGDWRFKQKADRCAGRCVAWDLCQEGASNSAEWWHGWQFVKNQDIDMKILGLHAEHCPLNGLRNIFEPSYMLRCGAIVLKQSENSLSVAFQRLHKYFTEISTADLNEVLIVRLRLEAIVGVIDKALSRCTCRAQRFVDPWHFGNTRTYTCSSQCSNPTVTKQLTLARAQIQMALDCLTTSAVLNHLLQRKSLQFGLC